MSTLVGYELHRLETPLGRVIGDNSCAYDRLGVIALCLKTSSGLEGWGYTEVQAMGRFDRAAPWIRPLPDRAALVARYEQDWWQQLGGRALADTETLRRTVRSADPALDGVVGLALWDLMAQEAGMPLYRLLGGATARTQCRAYGSLLDFPLADSEAVAVARKLLSFGIADLKIKVGAESAQRDIDRLRLIAAAAGPAITLSADANEAWDWMTALVRLEAFAAAGINLQYIEDPLPRDDIEGFRALCARSPVPVIGHDYLSRVEELEPLVEAGLKGIRTNGSIDYMLDCLELAQRYRLPVYVGNSFAEVLVHFACAFPQVDRLEYSDLALSDLITRPVVIVDGVAIPSEVPGHGLVLRSEFRDAQAQH